MDYKKIISKTIKSFYINLYIGTPISWLLALLLTYRLYLNNIQFTTLIIIFVTLILLSSLITLVAPILAIKKNKKIIVSLTHDSSNTVVKLYNDDIIEIDSNQIISSETDFLFNKKQYRAIELCFKNGKIIGYIIPDFFENKYNTIYI